MKADQFARLLDFLERLERGENPLRRCEHYRDDAIMVRIYVPGEHWEIEFLDDGDECDVERFRQ